MSTSVRRGLYGKLAGDTTLTNLLAAPAPGYSKAIYHNQAPAGAAWPMVVFQKQAGNPTEAFGDPAAMDTDVWVVKAVDRNTSADVAESIAARIIALLNDAVLSISGSALLYLRRQSDVEYPEVVDGQMFQHVGSQFRLVVD